MSLLFRLETCWVRKTTKSAKFTKMQGAGCSLRLSQTTQNLNPLSWFRFAVARFFLPTEPRPIADAANRRMAYWFDAAAFYAEREVAIVCLLFRLVFRRSVHANTGPISKRNFRKAPKLGLFLDFFCFLGGGWRRKMHHAPRIFSKRVELAVFDDGQELSNWYSVFILQN